ncbi:MAG: VanW family protein [Deltaproteobacteria bacterium]|nr:VanW family protein [Deltaproteobacteria bacterium]
MRRSTSIALSVSMGIGLGLAGVRALEPRLPAAPVLRGLRVGGERVPERASLDAWLETRAAWFAARRVVLRHGAQRFETTLGDLGVRIDVAATRRAATAPGHRGSLVGRLRETTQARRGELRVPLAWSFDLDAARGYLRHLAPALRREPVDARLDPAAHQKIPDEPGEELDLDASVAELRRAEPEARAEIDLVTRVVPARVTARDLAQVDVTRVLSGFETRFQVWGTGRGRAANIARAASLLDGLLILPGEVVSFNAVVGPRSLARGFTWAPEILGDELTTGVGGGTCQVSSTLHAAALYGGLEVVERQSHSRPSDYTQIGLDATVMFPRVDLRLRNPHDFGVLVHAFLPAPTAIRVELLGGDNVQGVEYRYGISRVEDFVRRITVKPWLSPGRRLKRQKGTRGLEVHSVLTVRFKDGRTVEHAYFSGYKPSPEVFWVAPGYDESLLPALPDHAIGVEGRLERDGSDVYRSL